MEPKERRQVGAHYTSERDILKLINSLFLDELKEEFEKVKHDGRKLKAFHDKLGKLRFLDPACGCGNFLVVTYRELRLLELEVLKLLLKNQQVTDVGLFSQVDVDAMCGIEINEFPALIAEVAMWLIDHQMNLLLSEEFGQYFIRLPLKKSAKIVNANALRIDWEDVIKPEECSYIIGNPPFIGHQWRNHEQQDDMVNVWGKEGRFGRLDYVTCWHCLSARFSSNSVTEIAFVSTNSISQGEQVGILWGYLNQLGMTINFAHRTFNWQSEARGIAHVDVVIVGFSKSSRRLKKIYDYDNRNEPIVYEVKSISPYLFEGNQLVLPSRTKASPGMPEMKKGSQPTDGGGLIVNEQELQVISSKEPSLLRFIRRYVGAEELITSKQRWCFWLKDANPELIRNSPILRDRLERVKASRLSSPTASVRSFASTPTLFTQDRQPSTAYLAIPEVSSEARKYIPIAFFECETIVANTVQVVLNANLFLFGVLSSNIHMTWMRLVAGRLESRYRYTPSVYNNFPWPQNPTDKQKANVEAKAQAVLDARAKYPDSSLADLYDPLTMPPELVKAHEQLDKAVEQCYRSKPFESDRERVEYLFQLYEQLTAPLTAQADKPKRTRNKKQKDG